MILFDLSFSSRSSLVEGLTTGDDTDNLGVTVGKYTSKIDDLGKTVDSMQATILGLLPTVAKNTEDNAKNQKAIQSIIANSDKINSDKTNGDKTNGK